MKSLSLALISVLFASACAQEHASPATVKEEAAVAAPGQATPVAFTLATCLPPADTIYSDTKRLIFLVTPDNEGKGPMDLMFETEPSKDDNNNLGFTVMKGGTLDVGADGWIVSGHYYWEGGESTVDAVMPANRPGTQDIALHFTATGGLDVMETWACRVH